MHVNTNVEYIEDPAIKHLTYAIMWTEIMIIAILSGFASIMKIESWYLKELICTQFSGLCKYKEIDAILPSMIIDCCQLCVDRTITDLHFAAVRDISTELQSDHDDRVSQEQQQLDLVVSENHDVKSYHDASPCIWNHIVDHIIIKDRMSYIDPLCIKRERKILECHNYDIVTNNDLLVENGENKKTNCIPPKQEAPLSINNEGLNKIST